MAFIFAQHNFVDNFLNATGTGDTFMIQEMVNDQLAKLIIEHKAKVIKALRDNGISVKTDCTNQKVADAIIANVEYNKPLAVELKNLITKYNIPASNYKLSDASKGIVDEKNLQSTIADSLVSAIQNIGKKQIAGSPVPSSNGDVLKERIRLAEMQMAMLKKEKPGMSTGTKVAIGIGIGIVLIVGTMLVLRAMKKGGNKMSAGGNVNNIAGQGGTAPVTASNSPS